MINVKFLSVTTFNLVFKGNLKKRSKLDRFELKMI